MAKAKTPKTKKAPIGADIEAETTIVEAPVQSATITEDVDLDRELDEIPTVHGSGFQAYMREKIAKATEN